MLPIECVTYSQFLSTVQATLSSFLSVALDLLDFPVDNLVFSNRGYCQEIA